jgi:cytochrome c oxidase subunit 2
MNRGFQVFPEQASSMAWRVDGLLLYLLGVSGVMTVLIAATIVYFCIKYRKGSKADRTPMSRRTQVMIEATWITIPFVLMMIMFVWGAKLFLMQATPRAGALEVNVVGKQWMWKFQHPNGNREINELHVPLGRPVKLTMVSQDVIHSLFFPAFRLKHDVLPGRYTTIWFEATQIGEYHIFCAEYCGAKHSEMKGRVIVMEPTHYESWLMHQPKPEDKFESPVNSGRRLFSQMRCPSCHQGGGVDSRAPPLQNLFGSTVVLEGGRRVIADENYLRESILRPRAKVVAGFQPIMPPFESQLSEEGVMDVIAFIKSLTSDEREPGRP